MEIRLSDPSPKYTSLAEASRYCGLSESTLERMVRDGRLTSYRAGRRRLIEFAGLDRVIQAGRIAVA